MNSIPNRRHLLAVSLAFLLAGCAGLEPSPPSIPVAVDAAPFGEHIPLGYQPVSVETSDDGHFTTIYLAWDWNNGTRPEGPTSLVLLIDRVNDENYELTDFRNKAVSGLKWQADDLMRLETSEGRMYVGLDPMKPDGAPPHALRTEAVHRQNYPPNTWYPGTFSSARAASGAPR